MIHSQATKEAIVIAPVSVTTTEVTGTVDTLGYERATINVILDDAATTVTVTSLSVSEGETTSSVTAIDEFTAGTADGNVTLPAASGTSVTGDIIQFDIDLTRRKRYLLVTLASSAARIGTVTCSLSRAKDVPSTAAERGLAFVAGDTF